MNAAGDKQGAAMLEAKRSPRVPKRSIKHGLGSLPVCYHGHADCCM